MSSSPVAFVPDTQVARARSAEGVLSGLTFAAKDVFAVRGHVSSAGHPAWASSHRAAEQDAAVITRLLAAGADLVGVTILDELAYSLTGQNPHYGTPSNPRIAQRLCGGSSCGSAAAVAACLCDFALGTDTGGSMRVPASFCGLYGLRPTHAGISTEGVIPLAPSFDTVGFCARDADTFERVASVLVGPGEPRLPTQLLVLEDAFTRTDSALHGLLQDAVSALSTRLGLATQSVHLTDFSGPAATFRRLQGREVWSTHGAWFTEVAPVLSAPIAERMRVAEQLHRSGESLADDERVRAALSERLATWLAPSVLLCLPATPCLAPRADDSGPELEQFRAHVLELTSLASLTGFPQLVVPVGDVDGAPAGLSFIAPRGDDAWLASLAGMLAHGAALG